MRGKAAPGQVVVREQLEYFCSFVRQGVRVKLHIRRNHQPIVDTNKEASPPASVQERENEIRESVEALGNIDVADHASRDEHAWKQNLGKVITGKEPGRVSCVNHATGVRRWTGGQCHQSTVGPDRDARRDCRDQLLVPGGGAQLADHIDRRQIGTEGDQDIAWRRLQDTAALAKLGRCG
jgi:hypothetical protein